MRTIPLRRLPVHSARPRQPFGAGIDPTVPYNLKPPSEADFAEAWELQLELDQAQAEADMWYRIRLEEALGPLPGEE